MPLFPKSRKVEEPKFSATATRTTEMEQRVANSSSFSSYHKSETTHIIKTSTGSTSVSSHKSGFIQKGSSSSNSNFQKITEKKELSASARPRLNHTTSTDAKPFDRGSVYQSVPLRSAFFSNPLTSRPSGSLSSLTNYPRRSADNQHNITTHVNPSSNRLASVLHPTTASLPPLNNNTQLEQKLQIKVVPALKFYDDPTTNKVPVYKTRSNRRGKLLLINNIKFANEKHIRKGAELDEENLYQLFSQMGFNVTRHRNLKLKEMKAKITDFCKSSSLKKVDIGAVIVMSHGIGKERSDSTEVVCTDNELLETTWIIDQFSSTGCPFLAGKPKIFIFQCCRGENYDKTQTDNLKSSVQRQLSDMLIAYATIPGFVAHRDPELGSWYIQAICQVFMEHAHDTDVESLLKMVDNKLSTIVAFSGSKQTSSFENRGFKTCYLHPKLCEN